MPISLTAEQEQYVAGLVASGAFPSGEDVLREAFVRLEDYLVWKRKRDWLRAEIDKGLASLDAGLGEPFDAMKLLEEVRAEKAAKAGQGR